MRNHLRTFLVGSSLFFTACSFNGNISSLSSVKKQSATYVMTMSDKVVPEHGMATFSVSLDKVASSSVSFQYYTQDQTAIAGTDYLSVSGTAVIPAGQQSVVISVPIADNYVKNSNKTFLLQLTNAPDATFSKGTAFVEIQDNEYSPMTGVSAVDVGPYHSCLLTTAGGVKCWGNNTNGQIGDGTTVFKDYPTDVIGLSSGVSAISVGIYSSCALITATGGLKCWGVNPGNGAYTAVSTPTDVTGLTSGVQSISVGLGNSCAVTTGGAAKCWGQNAESELGDNTTVSKFTAISPTGLSSGVISISVGRDHTCAVVTGNTVKCWGKNANGQVGDGTVITRRTPTTVTGLSNVTAVSAGNYHNCALQTTGAIACWGFNISGELGDGTTTQRNSYVLTAGLGGTAASVKAGNSVSCALMSTGAVKCWGSNGSAQLGNGTRTNSNSPVDVTGLTSGVSQISGSIYGSELNCAVISASQTVKCWGSSIYGQAANGMTTNYIAYPADVVGVQSDAVDVASNGLDQCIINSSGAVKCWDSSGMHTIGNISSAKSLAPGRDQHSCVVTSSGSAKCWGGNSAGQLGDGSTTSSASNAVDVSGLGSGVVSMAVGSIHTCALTSLGGVKCWGWNSQGQLGDSSTTQRLIPVDVTGLSSGVIMVAAGINHTCALLSTGGVKCWGRNALGQLGDGTTVNKNAPVDVVGLSSGAKFIAAGSDHTCVIMNSGAVKCWGDNSIGALGDGTTVNRSTPVDVLNLSDASSITLAIWTTCALTNSGAIKCWGDGDYGIFGNGNINPSNTVVDSPYMTSGVKMISASGSSNSICALTQVGSVKCWGTNYSNNLNTFFNDLIPLNILTGP